MRVIESYGKTPLSFELNGGQQDRQVKFISRGRGYSLFLSQDEALLVLSNRVHEAESTALRTKLLNANSTAKITGEDELAGKNNYFVGNDPSKWRTNVPTYGKVRYDSIYPGVELVYYGNHRQLEYDFVVQPGADPRQISFELQGADKLRLNPEGELIAETKVGELRWQKPIIYQEIDGMRRYVNGNYTLDYGNTVGFEVAAYDKTKTLIIDPTLVYCTYLGGTGDERQTGLAVDSAGNAYLVGQTGSADFPSTVGAYQPGNRSSNYNGYVTKLDSTGTTVLYSTYLGGTGNPWSDSASYSDWVRGIAVDSEGNAYLTGQASSPDFPVTNGAYQTTFIGGNSSCCGSGDAFVAKLSPSGSELIYSTFIGGSLFDIGRSIAIDSNGNAFVGGSTGSLDFPTKPPQTRTDMGNAAGFVCELNASGSAIIYCVVMGGTHFQDDVMSVAIDSVGNAYAAGGSNSGGFPTTSGAYQTFLGGSPSQSHGFVFKVSPVGSIMYSTYLGGSLGSDYAQAITVDAAGNAYVGGQTTSADFPRTSGAYQTILRGGNDGFLTVLNPAGSGLVSSTLLGGIGDDVVYAVRRDQLGNIYLGGQSTSADFPTTSDAFQLTYTPPQRASFVTMLSAGAANVLYSTYFSGSDGETDLLQLALDDAANIYIAGLTSSTTLPISIGAFQSMNRGGFAGFDGFAAKFTGFSVASPTPTPTATATATVAPTATATVAPTATATVAPTATATVAPTATATVAPTATATVAPTATATVAPTATATATPTATPTATSAPHAYRADVEPPINADGTSIFNSQRGVVPVKFALKDFGSPICGLPPATIAVTRIAGGTLGEVNESTYAMSADSGSNFRISSCQYIYNLSTAALGTGTYRVDIRIDGQSVGSALFQIK
jgi:hypothetical protein